MADGPPLLKPLPRRPFQVSSPTTPEETRDGHNDVDLESPSSPTSAAAAATSSKPDVSRSRSILNLTSSTLFGIYAPTTLTGDNNTSTPPTPWGNGAETPSRSASVDDGMAALASLNMTPAERERMMPYSTAELEARLLPTAGRRVSSSGSVGLGTGAENGRAVAGGSQSREKDRRTTTTTTTTTTSLGPRQPPHPRPAMVLRSVARLTALFCFGVAYGALVAHLHSSRHMTAVRVDGLSYASGAYLAFWGLAGIGMGSLLPWVDGRTSIRVRALHGVEWNDVVRSVGAFVGVAFAIRRLPWETTLQLSLTLALANPILWYLLDRTAAGLTISTLIGFFGTALLLLFNPALIPAPTSPFYLNQTTSSSSHVTYQPSADASSQQGLHILSQAAAARHEWIALATWIASVLFCSCVCFGNIGRLLVPE